LFEGTIRLDQYIELIEYHFSFYTALDPVVERALTAEGAAGVPFDHVRRAPILKRDLEDLGRDPASAARKRPDPGRFGFVTPESVAGVLYVIEGATLGGAQINRAAQRLLSETDPAGRRYWTWCRENNSQRWRSMMSYLDRQHLAGVPAGAFIAGAHGTFEVFADWMAPLADPAPRPVAL